MSEALPTPLRLLRLPLVEQKVALGRSAIYSRLDPTSQQYDASFPKPRKLGNGKNPPVAWVESELDAWIASRVATSQPTAVGSELDAWIASRVASGRSAA